MHTLSNEEKREITIRVRDEQAVTNKPIRIKLSFFYLSTLLVGSY
jgi:hypothetical protein